MCTNNWSTEVKRVMTTTCTFKNYLSYKTFIYKVSVPRFLLLLMFMAFNLSEPPSLWREGVLFELISSLAVLFWFNLTAWRVNVWFRKSLRKCKNKTRVIFVHYPAFKFYWSVCFISESLRSGCSNNCTWEMECFRGLQKICKFCNLI